MIKDERTRDCMSREEMDAVLTSAIPYSWRLSERTPRSTVDPVVDRPLLNRKCMLPNCTIVLSMWFIIRSNIFTVWDISFILQKLLHSSMIPFPLNSSLNLHEYCMAYVSTASISSLHTQSLVLSSFIILQ